MVEVVVVNDPPVERPAIEEFADIRGIAVAPFHDVLKFHPQRITALCLKIHHSAHPHHEGIPVLLGSARVHDVLEIRLDGDRRG